MKTPVPARPRIALAANAVLWGVVLGAVLTAGCAGAGGTGTREPDVYEGCGSDELWPIFDSAEAAGTAIDEAASAPMFTLPTMGASLPAARAARFAWQPAPTQPGATFGDAVCAQCSVCGGGVRAQHLPPVHGTAYDLQFLDGKQVVYRVLTTLQTVTPADDVWAAWSGRSITLRAYRLPVDNGVAQGDLHTTPAPLAFSIQ